MVSRGALFFTETSSTYTRVLTVVSIIIFQRWNQGNKRLFSTSLTTDLTQHLNGECPFQTTAIIGPAWPGEKYSFSRLRSLRWWWSTVIWWPSLHVGVRTTSYEQYFSVVLVCVFWFETDQPTDPKMPNKELLNASRKTRSVIIMDKHPERFSCTVSSSIGVCNVGPVKQQQTGQVTIEWPSLMRPLQRWWRQFFDCNQQKLTTGLKSCDAYVYESYFCILIHLYVLRVVLEQNAEVERKKERQEDQGHYLDKQ